jgi:hypothetical protein
VGDVKVVKGGAKLRTQELNTENSGEGDLIVKLLRVSKGKQELKAGIYTLRLVTCTYNRPHH